uniref:TEP1-F n=1 Tax=Timema douglasi TaxID=61478 RepID=A0A7R8VCX9_TIMDO|nr:unnamed protein product [Timema douglasi]
MNVVNLSFLYWSRYLFILICPYEAELTLFQNHCTSQKNLEASGVEPGNRVTFWFYTVVAPKILRPNTEYHVAVTTQGASQPTRVTVNVGGKQDAGGMFRTSDTVTVEPYTTHIVKLEIGDVGPGSYSLTAEGTGGVDFDNSTDLEYVHKSYSVFIQTDKAIYKPGHKVQFRVLVLTTHLKPAVTGALGVFIMDGKGNRVKQWSRALTTKGVFSGEVQLSESPVLGDWNITVQVVDQTFHKSFQVAEYVLPKFEVNVDIPAHATFKDSQLVATIRAKYTYGKPVKGEATVTAYPTIFSGVLQPIFQTPVRKVIKIDGKATVEFDIVKELQLTDEFERVVQFDVAVEEALTGRRQNTTAQVIVHKYKYKMELIKTSEHFKPGLKYTAFVKLSYYDGAPVRDDKNFVTVRYGYSYDHDNFLEQKHKLDKDGMVELVFYPPADNNQTTLGIEAEYLEMKEWFSQVAAAMSPSNTFIQAMVKTDKPTVNQDVEIEVNSTVPLKYLSYQVIGRGDVLVANTVPVSNSHTHKFRFLATYAMAPTAHILVTFLKDDGEVVADALDIQMEGVLQNFVDIEVNPMEARPGSDVDIVVKAKPNSYVGILGIDQSVLLLKSGNDITEEDVIEELHSYDAGDRNTHMFERRRKRSFFFWPGSATAKEVFDKSGAVILTNGLVHEYEPFLFYRSNVEEDSIQLEFEQESAIAVASSSDSEVKVRRHFPETWLWELEDAGYEAHKCNYEAHDASFVIMSNAAVPLGAGANAFFSPEPPMAFEGASPATTSETMEVKVRHNFPETWLYEMVDFGLLWLGLFLLHRVVPPWVSGYNQGWVPGTLARNGPQNRPAPTAGQSTVKADRGPPVVFRPVTRPPLEGPYAFSRIPTPVWNRPRVFLPHDLAATWLFANVTSGYEGRVSLKKVAPDTITSWVITGFSVDNIYGLGLTNLPTKLRVFRPFFVSLDLPYFVIRGEIVAIPIVVFNYMDKDVTADVTLENEGLGSFEFAEISNEVSETPKLELYQTKQVLVKANSGSSVSFMIMTKKLGYITIKVSAKSKLAGDAVERKLLVKAEGETQYYNKALFVDLRDKRTMKTNVTLDIPVNVVPGSEMVEISAVGSSNVTLTGCTMNTNQLTQAIESKALRFLDVGYQQELTYRREDGSFSAFGSSDASGSTWLTAFVVKSFRQAMPHISIEENVIQEALQWLSNNQAANGSFPEVGKVVHSDMQGGAAKGLALTAYTLIAFLENQKDVPLYQNTISKAMDYIVRNIDGQDDVYAIAMCSYALQLANHPSKESTFNLLEAKAQSSEDMKWWKKAMKKEDSKNPWVSLPSSVDVEMTAYGLLSYLKKGLVQDAVPIMKWLVTQRNDNGGFASTQDTVIGIYALAKLAESISSGSADIGINFSHQGGNPVTMKVNRGNAMILQKQELPSKVRAINITASGTGFAVVQVSYRYNVNVTGAWPLFTLDPQVDKNSDSNHLQLSICSGFVDSKANESNMAVMEVTLPSGFTVDSDSLPSLQVSENVKRVETKDGDTVLMLYFDKMTRQEYCPTVSAFRTHKVAKQKPVPVTIYDYYDSSRRARVFYEPRVSTLCDICEGEDCGNVCSTSSDSRSDLQSSSSHRHVLSFWALPLVILALARFVVGAER